LAIVLQGSEAPGGVTAVNIQCDGTLVPRGPAEIRGTAYLTVEESQALLGAVHAMFVVAAAGVLSGTVTVEMLRELASDIHRAGG